MMDNKEIDRRVVLHKMKALSLHTVVQNGIFTRGLHIFRAVVSLVALCPEGSMCQLVLPRLMKLQFLHEYCLLELTK